MPTVKIIGVGEDGADSLNAKALRHITEADLLIGSGRLLQRFMDTRGEKLQIRADIAETIAAINGAQDRKVVVLASGDPNFYGIARRVVQEVGKDRVEIIPNVSAVQLAFARIKESWEDAAFYSAHGRAHPEAPGRRMDGLIPLVRANRKIAVLTDASNTPAAVADALLAAGLKNIQAFVCENLGAPDERITETTIELLAQSDFSPLNVLLLINENAAPPPTAKRWKVGIPDAEFFQRKPLNGLITKAEVRVVSLAKLAINEDSIVWDVGAGSGAVSIEAALLAPRGRVFAVERNAADAAIIARNIEKFQTQNVTLTVGYAPEALAGLPAPDAVFIGGSGGRLREIVQYASAQLRPGGHIVINLAILDNLAPALATLRECGIASLITQVAISRGQEIGSSIRLKALDPVFVVDGVKSFA